MSFSEFKYRNAQELPPQARSDLREIRTLHDPTTRSKAFQKWRERYKTAIVERERQQFENISNFQFLVDVFTRTKDSEAKMLLMDYGAYPGFYTREGFQCKYREVLEQMDDDPISEKTYA